MTRLEDPQLTVPAWLYNGMRQTSIAEKEHDAEPSKSSPIARLTSGDHDAEVRVIETVYSCNQRLAVLLEPAYPRDPHDPHKTISLSVNLPDAPYMEGTFYVQNDGTALLVASQLMAQGILSFDGVISDGDDSYTICRLCE